MPIPDPYGLIAEYYDLEHQHLVDDVQMYLQFIEAAGDPVLELACGTGRVLLPIARAGHRVVGLDASSIMLARCQQTIDLEGLGPVASTIHGNMTDATSCCHESFGVVIMAIGALLHLTTQREQLEALQAAHHCLDPRGQLIVDVFNPTPDRLHSFDASVTLEGNWEMADGSVVEKLSSQVAHSADQTIDSTFWYDHISAEGRLVRHRSNLVQRWVGPGELLLMLQIAGFQDWRVYGSYELDPLTDASDRLIVAAEKTKTD